MHGPTMRFMDFRLNYLITHSLLSLALSPTRLITYLVTSRLCGPLRALASLITDAHSPLSTPFRRHL